MGLLGALLLSFGGYLLPDLLYVLFSAGLMIKAKVRGWD
jgi:hypothetical protein